MSTLTLTRLYSCGIAWPLTLWLSLVVASAVLSAGCASAPSQAAPSLVRAARPAATPSLQQIASAARRAVVEVLAGDSYGTGFHVGGGFVVTNVHVVEGSSSVVVRFENEGALTVTEVQAYDAAADLAVLRCPTCAGHPRLATIATADPSPGEHVFTLGNPRGLAFSISDGIVAGVRLDEGVTLVQITAPISPGSSGGPVLNDRGEVVAATRFYLAGSQNLNFAVSSRHIAALLARKNQALGLADFAIKTMAARDKQVDPRRASTYLDSCRGDTVAQCEHKCQLGDLEACEVTAIRRFVTEDADPAIAPLLEKACSGGRPGACMTLASMVAQGLAGFPKDETVAADIDRRTCILWRAGCDAGVSDACCAIAACSLPGAALPEDLPRANSYYRKACDLGNGFGCWSLARSYSTGRGVPADPPQAEGLSRTAFRLWQRDCAAGKKTACDYLSRPPR